MNVPGDLVNGVEHQPPSILNPTYGSVPSFPKELRNDGRHLRQLKYHRTGTTQKEIT